MILSPGFDRGFPPARQRAEAHDPLAMAGVCQTFGAVMSGDPALRETAVSAGDLTDPDL